MVAILLAVTSWKLSVCSFATSILPVNRLNMHLQPGLVSFILQTTTVRITPAVTDMSCSVLVRFIFIQC